MPITIGKSSKKNSLRFVTLLFCTIRDTDCSMREVYGVNKKSNKKLVLKLMAPIQRYTHK